jgi:hypothetical protein
MQLKTALKLDKKKYYKGVFIFAALYNILNSVIFLIISVAATDMFPTFGVTIPPSMIWLQLCLIFIMIYGIGYFIVFKNLDENHGIVIIGAIAKATFFLFSIIYLIQGDVNILIVLLGSIDMAFVILFIEFLLNYKNL